MTTIGAFLVAIAVLVVFHELGHYTVARWCGVKVLRFSIGFGNILYTKKFVGGETEWVISAIPLGGYVKMLDEREGEVAAHELNRAFNRRPVGQRMAVVVAGPVANLLLAILLYWVLFMHGVPGVKPILGEIAPQTPAAGSTIAGTGNHTQHQWREYAELARSALGFLDLALQGAEARIEGRTVSGSHNPACSRPENYCPR
ncbi:MAG: site-2 protease family protein [Nitrosomonadales bacterium]